MMMFIAIAGLLLTTTMVLLPLRSFCRESARHHYYQTYRTAQLCAIKRYYPQLRRLTFYEIEQNFDVGKLYHSIGRY